MSADGIYIDDIAVDEMSVVEMSVDKMSAIEMSVDKMAYRRRKQQLTIRLTMSCPIHSHD